MPRSKRTGRASGGEPDPALVVNGWKIYAHPLFLDQLEAYRADVVAAKAKDPSGHRTGREAKMLAAVVKLAFEQIPADPTAQAYRQGETLGAERKHWFRAKFFQQYRLFFRYRLEAKVIVFAWVNDDDTKRAYGSKTDAYAVFRKMLTAGDPPDSWEDLLKAASSKAATARLSAARREP